MSETTFIPGEVWDGPPPQPSTPRQNHSLRRTVEQIGAEHPATVDGPGPWCTVTVYTDHPGTGRSAGRTIFAAESAQYAVNNLRHFFRGKGFEFGREGGRVLARHIDPPAEAEGVPHVEQPVAQ